MKTSVGQCLISERLKGLRRDTPERRRFINEENKKKIKMKTEKLNRRPRSISERNRFGEERALADEPDDRTRTFHLQPELNSEERERASDIDGK